MLVVLGRVDSKRIRCLGGVKSVLIGLDCPDEGAIKKVGEKREDCLSHCKDRSFGSDCEAECSLSYNEGLTGLCIYKSTMGSKDCKQKCQDECF